MHFRGNEFEKMRGNLKKMNFREVWNYRGNKATTEDNRIKNQYEYVPNVFCRTQGFDEKVNNGLLMQWKHMELYKKVNA